MKKYTLFIVFLALFLQSCQSESTEITQQQLLQDAIKAKNWNVASNQAQSILIKEFDHDLRWEALQGVILSAKNLGNISWLITSLEDSKIEFSRPAEQKIIYSELIDAYVYLMRYKNAVESCQKLLSLNLNTSEERTVLELKIIDYSMNINDFETAEKTALALLSRENTRQQQASATFRLANLYYLLGKEKETLQYIEQFLLLSDTLSREKGQAFFIKGDMLEMHRKLGEAKIAYTEALKFHPNPDVVEKRLKNLEEKIQK